MLLALLFSKFRSVFVQDSKVQLLLPCLPSHVTFRYKFFFISVAWALVPEETLCL